MVRCCLESLALKYRWAIDRLEAILGSRIATVHIVGGGTKNALLCQFTADGRGPAGLHGRAGRGHYGGRVTICQALPDYAGRPLQPAHRGTYPLPFWPLLPGHLRSVRGWSP